MDDNTKASRLVQNDNAPSTAAKAELEHVTEEMYKKNRDLAETNKILSLLRKIDAIILSSVTEIQQVAQQVANTIVDETGFKALAIFMFDKKQNYLERLAVSQTELVNQAELTLNRDFQNIKIPLAEKNNLIVKAVISGVRQATNNLQDILIPDFNLEEAQKMQQTIGIVSSIVYPLIVREELIGALVIHIGESEESLSVYKKDLIDRLAGVIGIAIDNALLYKAIEDANKRLKEVDELKDEFVSLASHELRTPMTVIKYYLWMIINEKNVDPEKQKMYLSRAYISTERLINLVNDMLNVSRIESGRLTLNIKEIDIVELVNTVYIELLPKAQEQKINFQFIKPIDATPKIQADPDRLEQVLINLIGNSLKFTPENGTIKISVTNNALDKTETIAIEDNGKGIMKEDLAKLFQKFSMVGKDRFVRQGAQGTGLGLYLSKLIVELHGGKILAESEGEGRGTKFSITLKTQVVNQPQVTKEQ